MRAYSVHYESWCNVYGTVIVYTQMCYNKQVNMGNPEDTPLGHWTVYIKNDLYSMVFHTQIVEKYGHK